MRNFFRARQVVAMCAVAMSLLALTAQPAMAAGGYASIERVYDLSGDRHGLRIDARVTDTAPGSGLGLGANWGNMNGESYSSTAVIFTQGAGTAGSRGLKFDG